MSGLGVLAGTPRALPGHSQGTSRALPGHSHPHNCPRGREQLREVSTCSLPPSLPPSHCTGVTKMDSHNIKALSSILCVRLSMTHARCPFCTGSCCGRGRFNPAERTSSKDCLANAGRVRYCLVECKLQGRLCLGGLWPTECPSLTHLCHTMNLSRCNPGLRQAAMHCHF